MSSLELSVRAESRLWHRIDAWLDGFARAGLLVFGAYALLYTRNELSAFREDWKRADVMQISAYALTVLGLALCWNLRKEMHRFIQVEKSVALAALSGMALIVLVVAAAWMSWWATSGFAAGEGPWAIPGLSAALFATSLVGERYGRLFDYGREVRAAIGRGRIVVEVLHPDGVLGIGRAARLYALIIVAAALPVIWIGVWWALASEFPSQGYETWQKPLLGLWLISAALFYGVVMRPVYALRMQMAQTKDVALKHFEWTQDLDVLLRRSVLSAASPSDALTAHKELANLRNLAKAIRDEPTWPLPAEYRRWLVPNYALPAILPIAVKFLSSPERNPIVIITNIVEELFALVAGTR